ncbi:MAG: sensor histidine kinase [Eubacteriales bacterium]
MDTKLKKFKLSNSKLFRGCVFVLCVMFFVAFLAEVTFLHKEQNESPSTIDIDDLLTIGTHTKDDVVDAAFHRYIDSLFEVLSTDGEYLHNGFFNEKGVTYFISNDEIYCTNLTGEVKTGNSSSILNNLPSKEKFINKYKFIFFDGKSFLQNAAYSKDGEISGILSKKIKYIKNNNIYLGIAFDKEYVYNLQNDYLGVVETKNLIYLIIASFVLCLISFIYLAYSTGLSSDGIKLYRIDFMWSELQLLIILILLGVGLVPFNEYGYEYYFLYNAFINGARNILEYAFYISPLVIIWTVTASLGLWYVLSCIRLIKAKQFIKASFSYKFLIRIFNIFKEYWCASKLQKKILIMGILILVCIVSVIFIPLAVVLILISIYLLMKWSNDLDKIIKGADEVKNGNLDFKIEIKKINLNNEFCVLADLINGISEVSSEAVKNELKNHRMKTELISNVSHDLKTPLTSIINYVDLLKKEELENEKAKEYLDILDKKADRLKVLTEDLFEAAKASSGAMPVNLTSVEMLSLINQGLGEMNEKIATSGLEFIVNAENDKYYVSADGGLLWRVLENLLNNVLKYAMKGSRVYIDVFEKGGKQNKENTMIIFCIKNISANPLNMPAEELMERFKRGDEARNTEGSGLGLAIAKDLVKLQGGWLDLTVDGDLFKVEVMLKKYTKSLENFDI